MRALVRELPGLALPALVLALLLGLLLPLPTTVIDLALSLSLASAVLLLVAGLRVARVAEFLAFPTLVLLLALVRLVLNVSTTRLILSQADAGRVIDAFASLVVRGDLLIGAVMFAVITAIQYVVIARGAERVAEVAARFALDGMPGQQASIDADLRAGAIGPRDAQARRAALLERSEFYARMDGVMRFIKGDAIVGLLITAINLVGGVVVGATRAEWTIAQSLTVYGRLAIGDGLLAQLPALLVALAAAVLVARVDRDRGRASAQWLEPAMLLIPAILLGVLAPIPGMPGLAFATVALGLLAAALWIAAHEVEGPARREVEIRVLAHVDDDARGRLSRALTELRERCERSLAIPVPRVTLAPAGELALERGELELRLGERVLGRERMRPPIRRGPKPETDDAIVLGCFHVLMRSAERLVTLERVEAALEEVRRRRPSLVRQALRTVEPIDVLRIVRGFVRARLPAPRMDALVEALVETPVFADVNERARWPEHAREALADCWVRDLIDGVAALGQPRWLRSSADLDAHLAARSSLTARGVSVALSDAERRGLLATIREPGRPTLIVCSGEARAALASLVADERPHVPVVSVGELRAAGVELPRCELLDLA